MRTTVHILNLNCCGCESVINNSLSIIKNISDVDVDYKNGSVSFNYHSKHDFEAAKHQLSRIGYPIIGVDNKLKTRHVM